MKVYLVWEEGGNSGYQSLCGIYNSKDKATEVMQRLIDRLEWNDYIHYITEEDLQ